MLVLLAGTALAPPASAQDEPVSETITVTGRGWGHGRGLGQWGAFGYATGRSGGPWDYRTILDHFYGDTEIGDVTNPLAAVTLLGPARQGAHGGAGGRAWRSTAWPAPRRPSG